ncbi:SANT and BTB domain regulator of class switch recombination [Lutzomyia longipalpis]|uniref:SANT and BTB domain-containing protein n=1 Tax=Lutzomyia longipalpis TaxID=7200 RepID=A0A1B0GJ25_LUTLO|nr:SANT and BTB domain regulator of class switch recombination [Lutzomyia longipalpis]
MINTSASPEEVDFLGGVVPEEDKAELLSMNRFLGFLKLTCQVNESIECRDLKTTTIDYNDLAKNDLVNSILNRTPPHQEARKSPSSEKRERGITVYRPKRNTSGIKSSGKGKTEGQLDAMLGEKLDEVINEGILDSVLPFICPNHPPTSLISSGTTSGKKTSLSLKPQNLQVDHKSPALSPTIPESDSGLSGRRFSKSSDTLAPSKARRKSLVSPIPGDGQKHEAEIVIHVCDEVKNISRDFTCPQKLLVSKMGYFPEVTAGQRLEDMDISVHCDIQIFEWLMKWVKRDTMPQPEWPTLDPFNVIPILVSASFLQMEPLLLDCLSFCHARLSDIVKASANLSCLNEGIVTRLAAMFTNLELEGVRDKKDRVVPRLWTKMIQSLCEPEPQALRGHFASLAGLFRCSRCGRFLTPAVASYVFCLPQNMRVNRWGQIVSQHTRDSNWNITSFIAALYKELRSWRKLYWRLWGHCHFLYCAACETHFPVYQMNWCQYHPDQPQFLGPAVEGRTAGPAGRYPCCGQQAYRYETLTGPSGCQYREHSVSIENDRDRSILQLAQVAAEGGCLFDVAPMKSNTQNGDPWWTGIALLPHRSRQGLLPMLHVDEPCTSKSNKKCTTRQTSMMLDSSSDSESSDNVKHHRSSLVRQSSYSSDGGESEYSSPRQYRYRTSKRRPKMPSGRYWSGEMSARSNQDNQREFEERAMKQVIAMLCKKTGSDTGLQHHQLQQQNYHQHGGTYVRLEAEWRESLKNRGVISSKNKSQK